VPLVKTTIIICCRCRCHRYRYRYPTRPGFPDRLMMQEYLEQSGGGNIPLQYYLLTALFGINNRKGVGPQISH